MIVDSRAPDLSVYYKNRYFAKLFLTNISFPAIVSPSLITRPANKTVVEGDQATFHCEATGNPTPTIKWIRDGKTVVTGETLSFETKRKDSGKYWCLTDNGLNSTANASAYLDVQCECEF